MGNPKEKAVSFHLLIAKVVKVTGSHTLGLPLWYPTPHRAIRRPVPTRFSSTVSAFSKVYFVTFLLTPDLMCAHPPLNVQAL